MLYPIVESLDRLEQPPLDIASESAWDMGEVCEWISIDINNPMATPPHET